MRKFINDENGFVLSAELVIIATLVFCGVIVGLSMVRDALVTELGDVAEALGNLNQSYNYRGVTAETDAVAHGTCSGSAFSDESDDCDQHGVVFSAVACGVGDDPSSLNRDEGTQ